MLSFLKKLFGGTEEKSTSVQAPNVAAQVPESVLDRFLLNCQEFYYIKPGTNKIVFLMKGKDAKINDDPMTAGISIMALMWLRNIYETNRNLFASIINKYQESPSVTDNAMRSFLWAYFRTGNSTKQPQLSSFYQRGTGIVGFIDSLVKYAHLVFDEDNTSSVITYVNSTYGQTSNISSITSITAEDFAKIIIRDMHSRNLNCSDSKPSTTIVENPEEVKHVRPKMPRQQKQQKNGRTASNSSSEQAYLLVFSASWCGPSKKIIKEINEAGIDCYSYINVDEEWTENLVSKYNVRNVPLTLLVKTNGEIINKWVGYDDEDPGQSKFASYIRNCNFTILPFTKQNTI